MSRQDIARAALRTLSSHDEEDERVYSSQHAYPSYPQDSPQHHTGHHSSTTSIGKSYFGGNALQITDSPTTSPVLGAINLDRNEGHPRSILQRRRGRHVSDLEGHSTPGTNDVPSLSLSNSSFSDGPLRSPFTEQAPNHNSASSTRTLVQTSIPGGAMDSERYASAISEATLRRVASNLRMPVDDVRRVHRCMSLEGESLGLHPDEVLDEIGRESFDKIVLAFRYEQGRLSELPSFQSSYLHSDSVPSDVDVQDSRAHYTPLSSSRYTPLSPTASAHDELDLFDRSAPIPSPREALQMLASGSSSHHGQPLSPHSPTASFEPYSSRAHPPLRQGSHFSAAPRSPYNDHRHSRQFSNGSRPHPLPDRSYHSMDDYTPQVPPLITSPLLRGENSFGARNSIQSLISSPTQRGSASRQASRSPFIDSPVPMEDDDMETDHPMRSSSSQSPLHLRPTPFSPKQRSSSSHLLDGLEARKKASRRASAEVLSRSIKRAASPFSSAQENQATNGSSPSNLPISHEEVMARLKRKVKERLAARGASSEISSSNVIIGGRNGNNAKAIRSPSLSKHASLPYGANPGSIGRGARRINDESSSTVLPTRRHGSFNSLVRPHKRNSLRAISREICCRADQEHKEDLKMEEDVYDNSGTAGMGIEALLSAAAIADNPQN